MSRIFAQLRQRLQSAAIGNTGSEARDHFANERTFLAWTRSGVAFAAMGLALGRLDVIDRILESHEAGAIASSLLHPSSLSETKAKVPGDGKDGAADGPGQARKELADKRLHPATICQGISVWCLGYGLVRYSNGTRRLMRGKVVPAVYGPIALTAMSFAVFVATL